jgi:acyl-coenzyme A synthetase/AMP-(fatty) acid ligase
MAAASAETPPRASLWGLIAAAGLSEGRFIADPEQRFGWRALTDATTLEIDREHYRGKCVMIAPARQLPAALAAVELDGIAGRMVLCPPDLAPASWPDVARQAGAEVILHDGAALAVPGVAVARCGLPPGPAREAARDVETEWVLFTSGTTGKPKLLIHTLAGLTGPLDDGMVVAPGAVWSTFYDIRRYGGLQIFMRACLGGGAMVLSDAAEPVAAFLGRAGTAGVTHISGTPSHWRRALMSPAARAMNPAYVRLSGEVADQTILNNLRHTYPKAAVAHAFASTEAGVAFDVRDGLAGFPAALVGGPEARIEMRVVDGSLRIRSARTALRYVGEVARPLADAEGFVDTGDMVTLRDGRYYFVGRREGVINVGGQKVHPEEVEAVVNQHPGVRMSRVLARPSPITGAIVVAEVVMAPGYEAEVVTREVLAACRAVLPAHKVPATLRTVPALDVGAAGKLARRA